MVNSMSVRSIGFGLLFLAFAAVSPARAADPAAWLDEATRYEIGDGVAQDAQLAFAWYLRAAKAGLPQAEMNVAVMLDSGRGVPQDVKQAATWYARAALHGNRRAAYDLGQIYEAGEGVPRNVDLARAWFAAASDLPAARARLAALHSGTDTGATLSAPIPVAPSTGERTSAQGGIELVWTSRPQPEPVTFFVELRKLDVAGSHEISAKFADAPSATLTASPDPGGDYAWRVTAVAREANHYAASDWMRFSVAPD